MNLAFQTQSVVKRQYPNEVVLFSTNETILETRHEPPISWSLRRFFQRRGNVVIADARIFIQSSFLSPITVSWLFAIGYGLYL